MIVLVVERDYEFVETVFNLMWNFFFVTNLKYHTGKDAAGVIEAVGGVTVESKENEVTR